MEHKNYYRSTLPAEPKFPLLQAEVDTDVCIIGGGYAGLMTQLGLLERGINDSVLLEGGEIAAGASGRNGGFVFGGYSLSPRRLVTQVGAKTAKELYDLSLDAVSLIRQRVKRYNIECELAESGVIWANWFKSQRVLLDEKAFMRRYLDVDWQYLNPKSLREKINSTRYHGALLETNAMHFNPLKYALGIAQTIQHGGADIFAESPAISIDNSGPLIKVKTPSGSVRCRHLVISAGGYIDKFYPKIARAILPIATYVCVTEKLEAHYANCLYSKAAVYDTRFAFDYYRPLKDGRLLWGGRISANTQTPRKLEQILRRDMRKVFPQLAQAKIDYVWSGLMGYPRHQMPIIGQVDTNIWSNIGYGGHGVGPSSAGGELIASAISEGDKRYQSFSKWGPIWAGGKLGSLAAQISYWTYQSRDFINEKLGR